MGERSAALDCVFELRITSKRCSSSERGFEVSATALAPRFSSAGLRRRLAVASMCGCRDRVFVDAVRSRETDGLGGCVVFSLVASGVGSDLTGKSSVSETYTAESLSYDLVDSSLLMSDARFSAMIPLADIRFGGGEAGLTCCILYSNSEDPLLGSNVCVRRSDAGAIHKLGEVDRSGD